MAHECKVLSQALTTRNKDTVNINASPTHTPTTNTLHIYVPRKPQKTKAERYFFSSPAACPFHPPETPHTTCPQKTLGEFLEHLVHFSAVEAGGEDDATPGKEGRENTRVKKTGERVESSTKLQEGACFVQHSCQRQKLDLHLNAHVA